MGNVHIAAKVLFDGLGIDYVIPPLNSKRALEIGSLYSPEEICLPFKIQIGNYIQSIENGADTIIITGSCGPCRFGEYCELQMNILSKLGHDLEFIVIDSPNEIGKDELLRRIKSVARDSKKNKLDKLKAVYGAVKTINLIDKLEAKVHYLSGYEAEKNECRDILDKCKQEIELYNNPKDVIDTISESIHKLDKVKLNKLKKPLKIAIIGEIYTVIEPFSNLYIENKLMDYGVSSKRMLTPSWWVKDMLLSPLGINSRDIHRASKDYIPLCIGGHAVECVGEAVLAADEGLDGAIQIFPMGCMPEIVSKAILSKISKDKDFPIMTLIVDEMTGEAGYITRVEAFLDLLERRRNKDVLSWS
jgi:predicted nucleotide-binding protein (sugar kinase/HSP70/actin superfamily)